eukprot:164259_1
MFRIFNKAKSFQWTMIHHLLAVYKGILSVEWLINHKKCKGLPLYIPDLIICTKLLNKEEKKAMMLLIVEFRTGYKSTRPNCTNVETKHLVRKAKALVGVIRQMVSDACPHNNNKKYTMNRLSNSWNWKQVFDINMGVDIDTDNLKILDQLVTEQIESFL